MAPRLGDGLHPGDGAAQYSVPLGTVENSRVFGNRKGEEAHHLDVEENNGPLLCGDDRVEEEKRLVALAPVVNLSEGAEK